MKKYNAWPSANFMKYMAWLPAAFMMAAIFWFSAQPADASTEMSDGVTRLLLRMAEAAGLMELSPERVYELCVLLSTPVRKCAHITEYAVLYLTVLFGLKHWGIQGNVRLRRALTVTVLYACTDEFHQLFVPGRAGMVTDVMIDSIGAVLLTAILWKRSGRPGAGKTVKGKAAGQGRERP